MYSRRWSTDRLHDSVPGAGDEAVELLDVLVRWLIVILASVVGT
jgi:hypothetical protein